MEAPIPGLRLRSRHYECRIWATGLSVVVVIGSSARIIKCHIKFAYVEFQQTWRVIGPSPTSVYAALKAPRGPPFAKSAARYVASENFLNSHLFLTTCKRIEISICKVAVVKTTLENTISTYGLNHIISQVFECAFHENVLRNVNIRRYAISKLKVYEVTISNKSVWKCDVITSSGYKYSVRNMTGISIVEFRQFKNLVQGSINVALFIVVAPINITDFGGFGEEMGISIDKDKEFIKYKLSVAIRCVCCEFREGGNAYHAFFGRFGSKHLNTLLKPIDVVPRLGSDGLTVGNLALLVCSVRLNLCCPSTPGTQNESNRRRDKQAIVSGNIGLGFIPNIWIGDKSIDNEAADDCHQDDAKPRPCKDRLSSTNFFHFNFCRRPGLTSKAGRLP